MKSLRVKSWRSASLVGALLVSTLFVSAAAFATDDGTALSPNLITRDRSQAAVYTLYDDSRASATIDPANLFSETPVLIPGSYNPGALSTEATTKTLAQINYFRALAGINHDITANATYFERGQYGATGLNIVGRLDHWFNDTELTTILPQYMTPEQIAKAQAGISGGHDDAGADTIMWNGNCADMRNVVESIQGYMDDTNNVYDGVGHRLSMLALIGQSAAFGASTTKYSTVGIYGAAFPTSNPNTQAYYPWPAEGYFPRQAIADGADWSLIVKGGPVSGNQNQYFHWEDSPNTHIVYTPLTPSVTLTYQGIPYPVQTTDILVDHLDNGSNVGISFELPTDLKLALASSASVYDDGGVAEVTVKVTGLLDASSQPCYAQYTTKLFKSLAADPQLTHAAQPTITLHPTPTSTALDNDSPISLTVQATVSDGGTLSYQWYRNTTGNTAGGDPAGTGQTLVIDPSTLSPGTYYYYAEVTNTNTAVTGTQIAKKPSNAAAVTIESSVFSAVSYYDSTATFTLQIRTKDPDGTGPLKGMLQLGDGINPAFSGTAQAFYIPSIVPLQNGSSFDIVAIAPNAFKNATYLEDVYVPAPITHIGAHAFQGSSVSEITFDTTLTTISAAAFANASHLTTLTFMGTTPPTISADAFTSTTALTQILIPKGFESAYTAALAASGILDQVTLVQVTFSAPGTDPGTDPGTNPGTNPGTGNTNDPKTGTDKTTKPTVPKPAKPTKPTRLKLKALKKRKLRVTWKANAKNSGYQILLATNKKFTKSKKTVTVAKGKTAKKTVTKLKKNKTYYVKIRAYIKVNGKKIYSAYSPIKKVKIKK